VTLQDEKCAVWRAFRIRDRVRLHDVSVGTFPHELLVWTFDVRHPAHCLLMGNVIRLWEGTSTRSPLDGQLLDCPAMHTNDSPHWTAVSHALADVARVCLGAQKRVPFSIEDDELSSPIEKAIERFVHEGHFAAVHPYSTFCRKWTNQSRFKLFLGCGPLSELAAFVKFKHIVLDLLE
jgi:hypothetical protein